MNISVNIRYRSFIDALLIDGNSSKMSDGRQKWEKLKLFYQLNISFVVLAVKVSADFLFQDNQGSLKKKKYWMLRFMRG